MKKTLLLCFIHGFKGGDDTFGGFPKHLRNLISQELPHLDVQAVTYPKFETRGDLNDCVAKFREWLQNRVIDIEVAHSTPSPTVDPSVRVILIGHSMGGIVAAETILSIISEQPIYSSPPAPMNSTEMSDAESDDTPPLLMFPYIQGLLAFDTPYLGINPGMVAQGAEGHYRTASTAYNAFTEAASFFGGWGASKATTNTEIKSAGALPAPPSSSSPTNGKSSKRPWSTYGKFALVAGAASAAAGALYTQRTHLTAGWSFVTSHLEFVGCLARGEELRQRLTRILNFSRTSGLGFAELYTCLSDEKPQHKHNEYSDAAFGKERTFCSVPKEGSEMRKGIWWKEVNEKAKDETIAHMSMFFPEDNPRYFGMCERARGLVVGWVKEGWVGAVVDAEVDAKVDVEEDQRSDIATVGAP
ncbi:MAG: hypothetical protein M1834_004762 [Cirrosporium novae-zelandiae]|nr:MAG: hypothetical protein M1834_004762 [Cirrosporium novae-zelandiae]